MEYALKEIIREAGALAKEYFDRGVVGSPKSNIGDLVTEADTAVSEFIVGRIQKSFPDHTIKSEELDDEINPGGEYRWVIDPIDGTRNFANRIPFWCTLIAVQKEGETVLGAVYNAINDDLFFAKKGGGAFLNDMQIHVNNTDSLRHAYGVVTRAYETGTYGDYIERYKVAMTRINLETEVWIHNFGTMLGPVNVSTGAIDFCIGNAGLEWDYRAPFLICEEAGAIVTDSDGNPWKAGRQDYVIANPDLHGKVMELFDNRTRIGQN
jgi:myo-inositol-1(or 4)-monophosphatase